MQIDNNSHSWTHIGLAVMFVLIGVAVVISVLYPQSSGGIGIFNYGWNWFGFFILVCIFAGLFRGFGWCWWPARSGRRGGDEKSILKIRYAKGEITKEKYESMMKDLDKY